MLTARSTHRGREGERGVERERHWSEYLACLRFSSFYGLKGRCMLINLMFWNWSLYIYYIDRHTQMYIHVYIYYYTTSAMSSFSFLKTTTSKGTVRNDAETFWDLNSKQLVEFSQGHMFIFHLPPLVFDGMNGAAEEHRRGRWGLR